MLFSLPVGGIEDIIADLIPVGIVIDLENVSGRQMDSVLGEGNIDGTLGLGIGINGISGERIYGIFDEILKSERRSIRICHEAVVDIEAFGTEVFVHEIAVIFLLIVVFVDLHIVKLSQLPAVV